MASRLPITDDELVMLWHGTENPKLIAERLQISHNMLQTQWRRLKIAGLIPERPRMPPAPGTRNSRPRAPEAPGRHRNYFRDGDLGGHDGRPRIPDDYDPLLEALRAHHDVDTQFETQESETVNASPDHKVA